MVKPKPDGYPSLAPYLIVRDADAAISFYCNVLGARERLRLPGPNGRVGHAELEVGGSLIMLADEAPEQHALAPDPTGSRGISLTLYVDDVDAVARSAEAAGARVSAPVETKFYGDRQVSFADPFGHFWHVSTHVEDVLEDELRRRAAAAAQGQH